MYGASLLNARGINTTSISHSRRSSVLMRPPSSTAPPPQSINTGIPEPCFNMNFNGNRRSSLSFSQPNSTAMTAQNTANKQQTHFNCPANGNTMSLTINDNTHYNAPVATAYGHGYGSGHNKQSSYSYKTTSSSSQRESSSRGNSANMRRSTNENENENSDNNNSYPHSHLSNYTSTMGTSTDRRKSSALPRSFSRENGVDNSVSVSRGGHNTSSMGGRTVGNYGMSSNYSSTTTLGNKTQTTNERQSGLNFNKKIANPVQRAPKHQRSASFKETEATTVDTDSQQPTEDTGLSALANSEIADTTTYYTNEIGNNNNNIKTRTEQLNQRIHNNINFTTNDNTQQRNRNEEELGLNAIESDLMSTPNLFKNAAIAVNNNNNSNNVNKLTVNTNINLENNYIKHDSVKLISPAMRLTESMHNGPLSSRYVEKPEVIDTFVSCSEETDKRFAEKCDSSVDKEVDASTIFPLPYYDDYISTLKKATNLDIQLAANAKLITVQTSLQEEIARLESNLSKMYDLNDKFVAESNAERIRANENQKLIDELRLSLEASQNSYNELKATNSELNRQLQMKINETTNLEKELQHCRNSSKATSDEIRKNLDETYHLLTVSENKLHKTEDENRRLRTERDAAISEISQLKSLIQVNTDKAKAAQEAIDNALSEREKAKTSEELWKQRVTELEEQLNRQTSQLGFGDGAGISGWGIQSNLLANMALGSSQFNQAQPASNRRMTTLAVPQSIRDQVELEKNKIKQHISVEGDENENSNDTASRSKYSNKDSLLSNSKMQDLASSMTSKRGEIASARVKELEDEVYELRCQLTELHKHRTEWEIEYPRLQKHNELLTTAVSLMKKKITQLQEKSSDPISDVQSVFGVQK